MTPKGRGGGHTPARIVQQLNSAIKSSSLRAVAKATGLGIAAISRYSKGIGEPSSDTLKKLADYLGVTVAFLRGAPRSISDRLLQGAKHNGVNKDEFNARMTQIFNIGGNFWQNVIEDDIGYQNADIVNAICEAFALNKYWLLTGGEPPSTQQGGFVGEIDDPVNIGIFGNYFVEKGKERENAVSVLKRLVDEEMYNKQIWLQNDRLEIAGVAQDLMKVMYEIMACVHDLFPDSPTYTEEVAVVMKKIAIRSRNNYTKFLRGEKPDDNFVEAIFGHHLDSE